MSSAATRSTAAVPTEAVAVTIFAAADSQYTGFHTVTISKKCVTPQLTMNNPKAQKKPEYGRSRPARRTSHAKVAEITTYDIPISRSAITVVHNSRLFPTKQYQCGRNSVESNARELSHITAVMQVSPSNPSFTMRGENAWLWGTRGAALADMRMAAFLPHRAQGHTGSAAWNTRLPLGEGRSAAGRQSWSAKRRLHRTVERKATYASTQPVYSIPATAWSNVPQQIRRLAVCKCALRFTQWNKGAF